MASQVSVPHPLAAFLIVSWNRKTALQRCLDSLREYIPFPYSVLVVDNASTDGTPDLLEKRYPEVHCLRNPKNEGFARAVNKGLDRLESGEIVSDYVVFLNDDTEFRDGSLQGLIDYLDSHPGVQAALPSVFTAPGRLQAGVGGYALSLKTVFCYAFGLAILFPSLFRGFFIHQPYFRKRGIILPLDWVSGVCLVLRRTGVESLRFSEDFFMYAEDVAFGRELKKHGDVIYYPHAQVFHWKEDREGGANSALWLDSLLAYSTMLAGGKSPRRLRLMRFYFYCAFVLRSWGYGLKGFFFRTDYSAKRQELRGWASHIRRGKAG